MTKTKRQKPNWKEPQRNSSLCPVDILTCKLLEKTLFFLEIMIMKARIDAYRIFHRNRGWTSLLLFPSFFLENTAFKGQNDAFAALPATKLNMKNNRLGTFWLDLYSSKQQRSKGHIQSSKEPKLCHRCCKI